MEGVASALVFERGLEWYVASLFSSYQEVHAAQLGVLASVVVAVLFSVGSNRLAAAALLGLLAFALGIPGLVDPAVTCPRCGSRVVQAKPWYFLSCLLATIGAGRVTTYLLARWRLPPALAARRNSHDDE